MIEKQQFINVAYKSQSDYELYAPIVQSLILEYPRKTEAKYISNSEISMFIEKYKIMPGSVSFQILEDFYSKTLKNPRYIFQEIKAMKFNIEVKDVTENTENSQSLKSNTHKVISGQSIQNRCPNHPNPSSPNFRVKYFFQRSLFDKL